MPVFISFNGCMALANIPKSRAHKQSMAGLYLTDGRGPEL